MPRRKVDLDWGPDGKGDAVGPDGTIYRIFSEHVRGEPRIYWVMMLPPGTADERGTPKPGCDWQLLPNGAESTRSSVQKTRARRHAEYVQPRDQERDRG